MSSIKELQRIKDTLLKMARLTGESIDKVNSLFMINGDLESRRKTWNEINEITVILENLRKELVTEVLVFIARRQPLGLELREAQIIISIAYDIYRISRYCREIAKIDMLMMPESNVSRIEDIKRIINMVTYIVKSIVKDIEELKPLSESTALSIDYEVDSEYSKVLKEVATRELVSRETACKALLMRHIERIVDHVVYIEQYLKELQS
ncbi:MAG: PhoU domain-containing protein [Desulfurococcaceae archaeon]